MNAVTQIADSALGELFERYDLGAVTGCTLAANGIENSNYFITLQAGERTRRCVLTILEQPSNIGGRAYVELLDTCDRSGLPVPTILRNRDGKAFETLYDKPALVSQRLPGHHVLNPTLAQTAALGRFLARYHRASASLGSYLPAYPRDARWLAEQVIAIEGWAPYTDLVMAQDAASAVASMLARADVEGLPRSVIHGDLFRDNALFNDAGLTGVLDFHHAATGCCLFDLAVVANDWCSDSGGVLDPERTQALLRSYHKIRPLDPAELWFFSTFTLYAGLVFYLARASALAERAKNASKRPGRTKNPGEYLQITRERLAHSFYLDPKLLDI